MTLRSRVFVWFPALWLLLVGAALLFLVLRPGATAVALLLLAVYLLPVTVYRLHDLAWPLRPGLSRLDTPAYSPWWGGHQFQVMYSALPALEAVLRLVPGLYSAWLRAWGSKVGRGVYWTPLVEITDRALLDIGDGVVFGHRVGCYAHFAVRRRGKLLLYVKPIRIGGGALLGAGSRLGPGAVIEAGADLAALTDVGMEQRVEADALAGDDLDRAA
jgi:hypothetical protein